MKIDTMKAVVCTKYGPPEVLQYKEVDKPVPGNREIGIRLHATAVTASDCIVRAFKIPYKHWFPLGMFMELMMGLTLGFGKPKNPILGMVFSGVVDSVGWDAHRFKTGDPVFGWTLNSGLKIRFGTYAEYICLPENGVIALKPADISHEEAAAIPYGGLLAWSFLKKGKIQERKKVLIYGSSGAIGTSAVQISKHFGAHVTGVCSTRNIALVNSLGADKVIDYTADHAEEQLEQYDLIVDAVGKRKHSVLKGYCEKVLNTGGKSLSVDNGSPKADIHDLLFLKELVEAGELKPVIDRSYPFDQIVEAHRYVDQGHKKGNVVIIVD